ncbi:MAG: hypothetical protein HY711_09205, partial [Candidatus Melainabacteria bacterium]|nr:hypothetical protein [Candidatus Melainabacteria bacterium]
MVKTISTEYRWSCVKRYIAFESPVSRWEKLIKQMGKHVHKSDLAGVNFRQLPLKARREVFNLVLGNQDMGSNSATTLFNV